MEYRPWCRNPVSCYTSTLVRFAGCHCMLPENALRNSTPGIESRPSSLTYPVTEQQNSAFTPGKGEKEHKKRFQHGDVLSGQLTHADGYLEYTIL